MSRLERSVKLNSGVPLSELTGPQRVEARMLDRLAVVLASRPQFQGPEGANRMRAFFDGISTVEDFEVRFRQSYGDSSLEQFQEVVVEQCDVTGLTPESTDAVIRMNLVAWAKSRPDPSSSVVSVGVPNDIRGENTRHGEVELIDGIVLTSEGKVREKNGWRKKTRAGLQLGPGTYSGMSKLERRQKRHNGRGLAGNGHK